MNKEEELYAIDEEYYHYEEPEDDGENVAKGYKFSAYELRATHSKGVVWLVVLVLILGFVVFLGWWR